MLNFFIEEHLSFGSNQTNESTSHVPRIENEPLKSRTHDAVPSILKQTTIMHTSEKDALGIPNTPAVHFYPRTTTHLSEHTSNFKTSELSTDGDDKKQKNNSFNQMFSDMTSQHESNGISPISPAAMCTTEVLMLPGSNNVTFQSNHPHPPKQQHLGVTPSNAVNEEINVPAWLQHMNMVATMSSKQASSTQPNTGNGMLKSSNKTSLPAPATRNKEHPMHIHLARTGVANLDSLKASDPRYTVKNIDSNVQVSASFSHDRSVVENHGVSNIHPALKAYIGMSLKHEAKEESKEKRAQRLARNRDSARQSRRRKKEMLLTLREKVNTLYGQLEYERRLQLEIMESKLLSEKKSIILDIASQCPDPRRIGATEKLIHLLKNEGPDTTSRLAVIQFQYRQLKRLYLPSYAQFLLELSLKDFSFFTAAKESAQKQKHLAVNNINSRTSSRIVGEEISKSYEEGTNKASESKLFCNFLDDDKMWPLFCHELTIGIDQEEKLLQALERYALYIVSSNSIDFLKVLSKTIYLNQYSMQRNEQFKHRRLEIYKYVSTVAEMKEKLLKSSPATRKQNLSYLLQILTPAQAIRYLKWMTVNKERCKQLFLNENKIYSGRSVDKLFEGLDIKKRDV